MATEYLIKYVRKVQKGRGGDGQDKHHLRFPFIYRLTTEKDRSCRSHASWTHTGYKFIGIFFFFFLFKSKSSGIPASRSIPFLYTEYVWVGRSPTHTVPNLYRFCSFWIADGALWTVLPVFKENLDCYYSSTTYSCLWVRIYFCINFPHENISVSSASSLT